MPRVAEDHINEWNVIFIARNNAQKIIRDVDTFCELIEDKSRPASFRWQKAREFALLLRMRTKELKAARKATLVIIDKLAALD